MTKIISIAILLAASTQLFAADITKLVCNQPEMQERALTKECEGNTLAASTICQGNEGKAWCKGANLDVGDVSILRVDIGFRNRHVPGKIFGEPIVLYSSSSTGTITVWIDKTCKIIDKKVEFSNASAKILQWLGERLGKRVEDSIPSQVPGC